MNERIKELHDKAFDGIDILEPNWFLKHNKKFAELIVKECGSAVSKGFNLWPNAVERVINEHFGVE